MTETEKLVRHIETLRESIKIDWADLNSSPLREKERETIRSHLEACQAELKNLLDGLLAPEDSNSD
jgi:hypothetical protein